MTMEAIDGDNNSIPDYLHTLHEDWFGEPQAPLLFRAINLEAWDTCRRFMLEGGNHNVSSQNDLSYVDLYGYSALHYASWWSNSAPLDVVRQIIDFSPKEYVALPNRKGRTPLHLAVWRGRDEVVEILVERFPEAASVMDRTHKTPLVDACYRHRSKRVLEALVKADPWQIANTNNHGQTAALIFFRISHGFVSVPIRAGFANREEQELFTEKARVVLSAERMVRNQERLDLNDDQSLLCATIESPSCPFAYIKYLLQRSGRDVASFRFENGKTILHVAVAARPFEHSRFFVCDRCSQVVSLSDGDKNNNTGSKMMFFNRDPDKHYWGVRCSTCRSNCPHQLSNYAEVPLDSKEQSMVEYLLADYPSLASTPDASGRLPLQVALEAGRTWFSGLMGLVMANPVCLTQPCLHSGLYPFQLAATELQNFSSSSGSIEQHILQASRKRRRQSNGASACCSARGTNVEKPLAVDVIATIFHLLREYPSLVKSATE